MGALLGAIGAIGASPAQSTSGSEVTREVKFAEPLQVRGAGANLHSQQGRSLSRIGDVLRNYGDYELSPFVDAATAQRLAEVRTGEPVPDLASWYTLTLPEGVDVDQALAELRALPEIEYAEPSLDPVPPP